MNPMRDGLGFIALVALSMAIASSAVASPLLENWPRWASRPRAQALKQILLQQVSDRDEGEIVFEQPFEFIGQFHKREDGYFVLSIAYVKYEGLEWGNARRPGLRTGFAELVAAVMSLREDLRTEFPSFRIVINSKIHNNWLLESFAELGFKSTCDAVLSGNSSYTRSAWEIP